MYKILIATHGGLSSGIINTVEMFCGKNDNVRHISLYPTDVMEDFANKFIETIEEFDSSTLVFTDLLGGTPNNIALMNYRKYGYKLICGINLPILIEAVSNMEIEELTDEYIENLVDIGKEGLKNLKL